MLISQWKQERNRQWKQPLTRQPEQQLWEYGRDNLCRPDESKITDTIVISKQRFYEGAEQRKPQYFEFLHEQAGYIRKRWWVLQFLTLVLTGYSISALEGTYRLQRLMGVSAALFVIMLIPELWKNRTSRSLEIEGASYYSLRQIYAARMLLFAMVDGILLAGFAGILSLTKTVSFMEIAIQFFLPMIVACCICFRTLCSRRMGSEYAACLFSMIWCMIWLLLILDGEVWQRISRPAWMAVLCAAGAYLTYIVRKTVLTCGGDWEREAEWG